MEANSTSTPLATPPSPKPAPAPSSPASSPPSSAKECPISTPPAQPSISTAKPVKPPARSSDNGASWRGTSSQRFRENDSRIYCTAMLDYFRQILSSQFQAALSMINQCAAACPPQHW